MKSEETPLSPTNSSTTPADKESFPNSAGPGLARKLGLFDLTMLVMGTVIGSGIFRVPRDVAELAKSPTLVLVAWAVGGLVTLAGSLVYAELVRRRPLVGGQYAFLREVYHPSVAFLYGWSLMWIMQSGGMAAVALIFAEYAIKLAQLVQAWREGGGSFEVLAGSMGASTGLSLGSKVIALVAIGTLTATNCAGVRTGSTAQNIFMMLKILAIVTLVGCGLLLVPGHANDMTEQIVEGKGVGGPAQIATALLAALVPVFFAYGGSHTTTFMAGEVRDPKRNFPPALVMGVSGVAALYVAVNFVCLHVLGIGDLVKTKTPAFDVMGRALGPVGAAIISLGIAISALGFLSSATLTSPRVYYAMAKDGLFFKSIAWIHPRTRVPVVAILLQGILAMLIAVSGDFLEILGRIMTVELIFWSLTALGLFVIRRRDGAETEPVSIWSRGHPVTTLLFIGVNLAVVVNRFAVDPTSSLLGIGICLAGLPVYFYWRLRAR